MHLVGALALLVGLLAAPTATAPASTETVRLLVPASAAADLAPLGIDEEATNDSLGWSLVEVPLEGTAEDTAAALSQELDEPVQVELTYPLLGPTDEPLFSDQWYHENTGAGGGFPDADIDSATAWARSLGSGVVVAVVDSGVDASHPDLAGQIAPGGWDFVDDDGDPNPEGIGHGTAVAGLIVSAVNGYGITGVAPSARILPVRSCDSGGCSNFAAAMGIIHAVDHGADVINLSFGGIANGDEVISNAIDYARSHDVVVVAAAGNSQVDLDHLPAGQMMIPAGLPFSNVIAVAASDSDDQLSGFSNFGRTSVDIAAPGTEIYTTGLATVPGSGFIDVSGTSFSAPIVAGAAALLRSREPGARHQEVIARLEAFVDRPAGIAGRVETGRLNIGRTMTRRFTDTGSSVFVNAIDWLAAAGITKGCNPPYNVRFCPGDDVTRGEMAVFLARAFSLPSTGTDYFNDDGGRFYEAAANSMAAAGLTVGCGSHRYCGERTIGRDEMAAMLARALHLPASSKNFFVDDNGSIFEGAINRIAAAGITLGCNPPANNRFCPDGDVTRGEMAAFIKRSVESG